VSSVGGRLASVSLPFNLQIILTPVKNSHPRRQIIPAPPNQLVLTHEVSSPDSGHVAVNVFARG
jgi:hypothetical protein